MSEKDRFSERRICEPRRDLAGEISLKADCHGSDNPLPERAAARLIGKIEPRASSARGDST